ncbi:MAG: CapA family protein [Actinobacteria bacterium]|nr:CapA family protein [Actinomycetota bacterium]
MPSSRVGNGAAPRKQTVFVSVGFLALAVLLLVPSWELHTPASRQHPTAELAAHLDTVAGPTATGTTLLDATTSTVAPARPAAITLAFAGDLLPHTPVNRMAAQYGAARGAAFDYAPMLAPMRPLLAPVDLAICHMEVPTHPDGEAPSSYPTFGAPPELVSGARSAGYDGCSTASNHSLDRGRKGIDKLLDLLDQSGMGHNGTARTPSEGDGRPTIYDVGGVKVAHLSWAYDFNGYKIPADAPWVVNQIDPARIAARAAEARRDGADLVVVSLHWGTEYQHDPSPQQEQWAAAITASPDVDLVIGHHAHVVQPISMVNGTYVVWGLGNQLSGQTQLPRRDGLTVRVHAAPDAAHRWHVVGIDAIPTFVDLPSYRVLPVVETLDAHSESPALDAADACQLRADRRGPRAPSDPRREPRTSALSRRRAARRAWNDGRA